MTPRVCLTGLPAGEVDRDYVRHRRLDQRYRRSIAGLVKYIEGASPDWIRDADIGRLGQSEIAELHL